MKISYKRPQRGRGHVTTEAETGMLWPEIQECQYLPEVGRGK